MFAVDEIDFSKYEDVVVAFTKLMTTFEDNVSQDRLQAIKNGCLRVTEGKFKEGIEIQRSLPNFFTLLSKNTLYCNCIKVRLLEIIATASGNKQLENLIKKYKAESLFQKVAASLGVYSTA